jgi:hypothetical protein
LIFSANSTPPITTAAVLRIPGHGDHRSEVMAIAIPN